MSKSLSTFARPSRDDPQAEAAARELARRSLIDYVTYTTPRYVPELFHIHLAGQLQQVVESKTSSRLMIIAPPQHGKSQLASVHLPAYWLGHRPYDPVIITSYGAHLAQALAGKSKTLIQRTSWENIFSKAIAEFADEPSKAKMVQKRIADQITAAGAGGPITGFGGALGIIDDPVKNYEEAHSLSYRDKLWRWYQSTFRTRIWENGVIVIIMTRWHEDDLIGRILNSSSENWTVLHYPALAMSKQEKKSWAMKNKPSMSNDPDLLGRKAGEALAPRRFSKTALLQLKADSGESAWWAEYQGSPRPVEGTRIKEEWIEVISHVPESLTRIARYWDKGVIAGGGARTAGVLMGIGNTGLYYIIDVVKGQWSPFKREQIIKSVAEGDNLNYSAVETWIEQEPGGGGKESALITIQNLAGLHIRSDRPTVSKEIRFEPFACQAEAGHVKMVKAKWNYAYIDELLSFPNSAYKDQVDATSGAFKVLTKPRFRKIYQGSI